jgi:hypothetical protein
VAVSRWSVWYATVIAVIARAVSTRRHTSLHSREMMDARRPADVDQRSIGRVLARRTTHLHARTAAEWTDDPQFVAVGGEAAFNASRVQPRI